jgi:cytochrome oxidase assembly protein ShyY1
LSTDDEHGRSWLGLLLPAIVAFLILIGLGTWQVERKAWKEGLIAALTERLGAAPVALPAAKDWQNLDQAAMNTPASPSAPNSTMRPKRWFTAQPRLFVRT